MRWRMRALLSWLILTVVPIGAWCQGIDAREVTGRLLFDRPSTSCEMIRVDLQLGDFQTVATAYTDSACAFRFPKVSPGSYNIHVNIDGYQEARFDANVDRVGSSGLLNVLMTTAPGRVANGQRRVVTSDKVDVTEILDRYPGKAVSLYNKAIANRKKGRNDDAIAQLADAIKIAPDFYQAHNTLGLAYRDSGKLREAEEHFVRAHEINRTSAEPLINLSGLYLDENRPELAEKASEEAVERNSRSAPALFNLGLSLYKIAQLDRAEAALLKAFEIAPKMFQIRLALANVYLKLNRFDNLMDQLNAYLTENPTGDARDQVERLKSQLAKRQAPF